MFHLIPRKRLKHVISCMTWLPETQQATRWPWMIPKRPPNITIPEKRHTGATVHTVLKILMRKYRKPLLLWNFRKSQARRITKSLSTKTLPDFTMSAARLGPTRWKSRSFMTSWRALTVTNILILWFMIPRICCLWQTLNWMQNELDMWS